MKTALLFPGQGAQYIGMCKDLINQHEVAARIFEEANDAVNFDLRKLIFEGPMNTLTDLENAQPAVVTASYAFYKVLLQETDIKPFCGVGHSLGEISALIAAGGISFYDGVRFAKERGSIMQQAYTEKKGRTALILDVNEQVLEQEVKIINENIGFASICCYNSPRQYVVSGDEKALKELDKSVKKVKGELVPFSMIAMKVDAPFHSRLMKFIEEEINQELKIMVYKPLQWNVISTVTALPYASQKDIENHLTVQLVTPVMWRQAISYIESQKMDAIIEVGPQSTMKVLYLENVNREKCYSFDNKEDRDAILKDLVSKK